MNLLNYFDRVYVVNLKRRKDRLDTFLSSLEAAEWPFRRPEVLPALDGRRVPVPPDYKAGGGAWGCLSSHLWILGQALTDGIERLLVLEDDCCFVSGFAERAEAFLEAVPDDWEQLMLGGQHLATASTTANPLVMRCHNTQRTHCYALRPPMMRALYAAWARYDQHCDWAMGRLHSKHRVYCPAEFLAGQDESHSDITNAKMPRRLWTKAPPTWPLVLLRCPREVVDDLRKHGVHTGYNRCGRTGVDNGLLAAFRQHSPASKLSQWCEQVGQEAYANEEILGVWHEAATVPLLSQCWRGPVVEVVATTVAEALKQLPGLPQVGSGEGEPPVVLLRAARPVAEGLAKAGWHLGFWRDSVTGYDQGLRKLVNEAADLRLSDEGREKVLVDGLKDWLGVVGAEARNLRGGLPCVWHPEISLKAVELATDRPVVEIEAATVEEGMSKLREARKGGEDEETVCL